MQATPRGAREWAQGAQGWVEGSLSLHEVGEGDFPSPLRLQDTREHLLGRSRSFWKEIKRGCFPSY